MAKALMVPAALASGTVLFIAPAAQAADGHTGGSLTYSNGILAGKGWTNGWTGNVQVTAYLDKNGATVEGPRVGTGTGSATTSTFSLCPTPGHWTLRVLGPQGTDYYQSVDV
ncbi:hypothetical protein [Kitasatospora sp. NPDC094011]|uniref:hypothetical protein n=1 Tax=Kitasatospora sp. NPDC094011 TaxID=3364090 RepID=UPI0037F8ADAF